MFQPNFVKFTNTQIVSRDPMGGDFKGNQNEGLNFVQFADGSGGLEKQMKDWIGNKTGRLYRAEILASQEYLASRVGEVMNAPIRDCLFTSPDAKTIVMPFIHGQSGEECGKDECYPENAQGGNLRLFDYLTANADRRPKNLMFTSHGIVGIDHALCNFRPREATPEVVSFLWNRGLTTDALLTLRPKLEALQGIFHQLGMDDKHQNLLDNLDRLIKAFQIVSQFAVVEKGDVAGHEFHGNQYQQVASEPEHMSLYRSNLKKFYDAGGKIERIDNPDKMLDVYHEAQALRETPEYKQADERTQQGIRFINEAAMYATADARATQSDSNPHDVVSSHLLVARDADGKLLGAVNVSIRDNYALNEQEHQIDPNSPAMRVVYGGYLGSTGEVAGTGTALMEQQIQFAGDHAMPLLYETTADSNPYHTMLGATSFGRGLFGFTAQEAQTIGAIPNPEAKVIKDTFTPPQGVQEAAKRALEWIADGKAGSGFTNVGRKRASDLGNGHAVSIDTLKRMKAYFDRHQPDKKAEGFRQGEHGYPSHGRVAWDAWGGDAGYSWAKKMVAHFNSQEVKKGDVEGHEFHGNQYTGGSGSAEGALLTGDQVKSAITSPQGIDKFNSIMSKQGFLTYPVNQPLYGGCGVVMKALQNIYPNGKPVAIGEPITPEEGEDYPPVFVQHYAIQIGDDKFVDSAGVRSFAEIAETGVLGKYWKVFPATPELIGRFQNIATCSDAEAKDYANALLQASGSNQVVKSVSKVAGDIWARFALLPFQKAKKPKDEHLSDKAVKLLAQEQEAHEAGDDDKASQLHYQVLNEVYK
jgi:hypothetical protein